MFPILSLLGVALATAFWPDSSGDSAKTEKDVDSEAARAEAPDPTENAEFASSSDGDFGDELIESSDFAATEGTDNDDVLIGTDAADTLSGQRGADQILAGDGDDLIYGTDDAEGDQLIGGDGHDQIWVGADDHAEGGAGDDVFHLGEATDAMIADYNPDNDRIIFAYDPNEPVPTLRQEDSDDGIRLFADDQHVATFGGIATFDLDDVHLVPAAA